MSETSIAIPRLHALIIGIDEYKSAKHRNLQGCVADAKSILDYLTNNLRVPRTQLECLFNEQATRQRIIDLFISHLINNSNIHHSDPIIIYFAGK